MVKRFHSGLWTSLLVFVSACALAPHRSEDSEPNIARGLDSEAIVATADDPCVKAAVADTNHRFPLEKPTSEKFFGWSGQGKGAWQSFQNLKNHGLEADSARYVEYDDVEAVINENYFSPKDKGRRAKLKSSLKGKQFLSLSFDFKPAGSLSRFYMIANHDEHSCQVEHIDAKLDSIKSKP